MEGIKLTIPAKVSENGTIFGSVSSIQIAEALEAKGITIDRKIINVTPVKQVGSYVATVKLHKEVSVEIPFEVIAENAPVEEAPAQETEAPAAE